MRHLRRAVVELDLAADDALGADREEAGEIVAFDVEIDERQDAGVVGAHHPVGAPAHAGLVRLDPDLEGHDAVGFERRDRRRGAAVDDARRQVPQQIDDERPRQPLEQAPELRPDAGERRHRRKEPVEDGGTQGRVDPTEVRADSGTEDVYIPLATPPRAPSCQPQPISAASACLFRSWHRGTRETDLILGHFAEAHLADFDAGQLDRYEALLECNDADLFDWVSGRAAPPAAQDHDVMRLLARVHATPSPAVMTRSALCSLSAPRGRRGLG